MTRANQSTKQHDKQLKLMLLPYAAGLIVLVLLPALVSFALAFFRYDGIRPPQFAGILSFLLAYTNELFGLSIANALAFVILPVPLRVFGAFLLARLLLRGGRWLTTWRLFIYLPSVIPTAAYALAWLWLLNPLFGPINLLLGTIGLNQPAWLVDAAWAKPGIILASLWQIGEGFIVALAALHDIPENLDDAAQVDGATNWQRFRHITLPLLAPILLILLFRDAVLVLQNSFVTIWHMTQGGPYYATFTLSQFIYEQAFDLNDFGAASAALWVLYLITGLVVMLLYSLAKQWEIGTTDEHFLL